MIDNKFRTMNCKSIIIDAVESSISSIIIYITT